jgi:hypothetical protein
VGERRHFSIALKRTCIQPGRGAYILIGGVGSGKTTFLRRFAQITERDFLERFAVWIHIVLLPIGDVDPALLDQELRAYTYERIVRSTLPVTVTATDALNLLVARVSIGDSR